MNTADKTSPNRPYSALAHLGCAALMLLLGASSSLGLYSSDFHTWLIAHPYTMLLGFLAALVAAYLLEHTLATTTMLALLVISFTCAGLALCSYNLKAAHALSWILVSGPLGYFTTAAITLHFQQKELYQWQLSCIFIAGAVLMPILMGMLLGEHFATIFFGINMGLITAAYELYILFSRSFYEITSTSRLRSTAIAMVMLTTVPVCKSIWYSILYGRRIFSAIYRIFLHW